LRRVRILSASGRRSCILEAAEEESFATQIEELKPTYSRIYDIKDAIIWVLCREPRLGTPLSTPGFFVYETAPLGSDDPKFWVLYKQEPKSPKVELLSITPVPNNSSGGPAKKASS
jgi:hypothetical protein